MGTHIGLFKWGTAAAFCSTGTLDSMDILDSISYEIFIPSASSPQSNPNNYTQLEFKTGGTIDISSGWTESSPGSGNWTKIFQTTPDYIAFGYSYLSGDGTGQFTMLRDNYVWTYFSITNQEQDVCIT